MLDEDELTSSDTDPGIQDLENYANDPANASRRGGGDSGGQKDYVKNLKDKTDDKVGSGVTSSAAGRFNKALGAIKGVGNSNKKKAAIAGGTVAFLIFIIVGIIGLAFDKLEGLMQNIFHKEFAKVERSVKKRATKIVEQRLFDKALNKASATDSPLLRKLYDRIPIDKIEGKLADKGYKFTGENGKIRVDGPDGKSYHFTSQEFDNFLNGDAGTGLSSAINDAAEAVTNDQEVIQRRFLRLLMRDEFDVKDWKAYEGKEGKDATTEVGDEEQKAATQALNDSLGSDVGCVLGDDASCPEDDDKRRLPDGNTEGRPTFESTNGEEPDDGRSDVGVPCDVSSKDKDNKDVSQDCDHSQHEGDSDVAKKSIEDEASGAADGRSESEAAKELLDKVDDRILGAGSIVGVMNGLADVDKFVWDDKAGSLIRARREAQYAGVFAKFMTMLSNIHSGKKVSGDEVNATEKLFEATTKTPGAEGSRAYSAIFNNDLSKGKGIDKRRLLGTNNGDEITKTYQKYFALPHDILQAFKATVGKILDLFSSLIGKIVSKIPGISSLTEFISKYAGKIINYVLGTVVSGTETGADLMNAIDVGGSVTAEAFSRDTLGAPAVSKQASDDMNAQILAEENEASSKLPITEKLFATSNPSSLINHIALVAPTSWNEMAIDTGNYATAVITSPIKFFGNLVSGSIFSRALAGPNDVLVDYGNQHYQYSNNQLDGSDKSVCPTGAQFTSTGLCLPKGDTNGPENPDGTVNTTPDGKIDQNDCPFVKDASEGNMCLADMATLISLGSTSTSDDDGGLGGNDGSSTDTTPVDSGGTPASGGTAAQLAQNLLSNPNYIALNSVKADLQATVAGTPINNASDCHHDINIDASLLQMMVTATSKYKISAGNIITGHECDLNVNPYRFHPKGKATDIMSITDLASGKTTNFTQGSAGDDKALDRQFYVYIASIMPQTGGGLGQDECPGRAGAHVPARVTTFTDSCNHQHIDVGTY